MVSISDAITAAGRNKVQVVWELSVRNLNEHTCEYSNHIHASATDEFIGFFKRHGSRRRMPIIGKRRPTLRRASSAEPCDEPKER
jgi:hypothetical protein